MAIAAPPRRFVNAMPARTRAANSAASDANRIVLDAPAVVRSRAAAQQSDRPVVVRPENVLRAGRRLSGPIQVAGGR
jgi:hypothetical protein